MATPIRVAIPIKQPNLPSVRKAAVVRTATSLPADLSGLSLPTEDTEVPGALEEHKWLIYGQKKVGKSSLGVQFPSAIHFGFEPAARTVKSRRVNCPTWGHFVRYIDLLEKGGHDRKTAVIDTGLEAYLRCQEWVCKKNNIEHPGGQNDYGMSWDRIKQEFKNQHNRLQDMGMGIIIICHEKLKESETVGGQKFDQIIPDLTGQADTYYRAAIDNVVYMHKRGRERFLVIRGSDYCMAGTGFSPSEHFGTPDGQEICAIPMGNSPQEAFENFQAAYRNEQCETFEDATKRFADEEIARSIRKHLKKQQKTATAIRK